MKLGKAFDNPEVTFDRIAKQRQGFAIRLGPIGGTGFLKALELDKHRSFFEAVFEGFNTATTGEESPTSGDDCRTCELRVRGQAAVVSSPNDTS